MEFYGFGVFKVKDLAVCEKAVYDALDIGYDLIDTAVFYENEVAVGNAVNAHKRKKDILVTTKVWPTDMSYDDTLRSFEDSYERLKGKLDIILLHWPHPQRYLDGYRALERLKNEGAVKYIGVSNFYENDLKKLLANCKEKPILNQLECNPYLTQNTMYEILKREDIAFQSWSPIARGEIKDDDLLLELARKYDKTVYQICLNWHIQRGTNPIPKSVTYDRIKENFEVFDFRLTDEEVKKITALNRNEHSGANKEVHPGDNPYDFPYDL